MDNHRLDNYRDNHQLQDNLLRVPVNANNTPVVIINEDNPNSRSTEVALRPRNITEMIRDRALPARTAQLVVQLGQ